MPVSKKCEQCKAVKRCRMFTEDRAGVAVIVYLCNACARYLGFLQVDGVAGQDELQQPPQHYEAEKD